MKVKRVNPMMCLVAQGAEKTCVVVPASQVKGCKAITLNVLYEDDGKEFCADVILVGGDRVVDVMHNVLKTLKDFEVDD